MNNLNISGRNNKAQIASTFTWMGAFLLIFFIISLFIYASASMAAPKKISKALTSLVSSKEGDFHYSSFESVITNKMITFLNTKFEGDETIYDLLTKAELEGSKEQERKDFFKVQAEKFLNDNFPASNYSSIMSLKYSSNSQDIRDYAVSLNTIISLDGTEVSIPIGKDKKLNIMVKMK